MKELKVKDISFIIPVFNNSEQQLNKCLDSLFNLSGFSIEIIIIDDGSKKKLSIIYKKLAHKYKARYFYEKNSGVSNARNLGIKKSNGNYISFVDADDSIKKNAIHKKDLKCKPDLIIYNVQKNIGSSKREKIIYLKQKNRYTNGKKLLSFIFDDGLLKWSVSKLFLRQFIIDHNILFDTNIKLGEDTKFISMVLKFDPFTEYISRILYQYNFSTKTEEYRERFFPLVILKNVEEIYNVQLNILNNLKLQRSDKYNIKKGLCKELIKSTIRIYSNYVHNDYRAAKEDVNDFERVVLKVKDGFNYDFFTKVQIILITSHKYALVLIYYYLRKISYFILKK